MNKFFNIILIAIFAALTYSCDSLSIYEEGGNCNSIYKLRFKYDMNIKFADAYEAEGTSLIGYLFDQNGKYITKYNISKEEISQSNFTYLLEGFTPDKYKMVIWSDPKYNDAFTLSEMEENISDISSLKLTLNKKYASLKNNNEEKATIDKPIEPIFHCYLDNLELNKEDGKEYIIKANLTKNTNVFRIILQNLSGKELNTADFNFYIEADNSCIGYDNSIIPSETTTYKAWNIKNGSAKIEAEDPTQNKLNVLVAELTTSRLVVGKNIKLRITKKDGTNVLNIPIIDYIIMTKGYYRQNMSNQEFLDRQDEYVITLFLDKNNNWDSANIIINGWTIVNNNSTLEE